MGHDSSERVSASSVREPNQLKRVLTKNGRAELEPGMLKRMQSAPHQSEQRESAFSAALRQYKAQKAAFKNAESSLFALFKSKSKSNLLKKKNSMTSGFDRDIKVGQASARVKRTNTTYSVGQAS